MDWTSSDVLHWIANVAENQKFPYEFVNANAFNVDGKTLSSFSKKQFIESDEKYGSLLYDALHKTGTKTIIYKSFLACAKESLLPNFSNS